MGTLYSNCCFLKRVPQIISWHLARRLGSQGKEVRAFLQVILIACAQTSRKTSYQGVRVGVMPTGNLSNSCNLDLSVQFGSTACSTFAYYTARSLGMKAGPLISLNFHVFSEESSLERLNKHYSDCVFIFLQWVLYWQVDTFFFFNFKNLTFFLWSFGLLEVGKPLYQHPTIIPALSFKST